MTNPSREIFLRVRGGTHGSGRFALFKMSIIVILHWRTEVLIIDKESTRYSGSRRQAGSLDRHIADGLNFKLLMGSLSLRRDMNGKMAHCRGRTADPAGTGASLCPMVADVVREASRRHQVRDRKKQGIHPGNFHDNRQRRPDAGGESVLPEIGIAVKKSP